MRHTKEFIFALCTLTAAITASMSVAARQPAVEPSFSWMATEPLGLHQPATIDTLPNNYGQRSVPAMVYDAEATTGNLGAEVLNMIYFERKPSHDFFFVDPLRAWLPPMEEHQFYNTRIPMTLLSYNTGGSRDNTQDRLRGIFSGNAGPRWQVGALVDYLYSKGMYNYQAVKDLTWGFSASYMGDKYQMQTNFFHYNMLNKENGGITDDLYITDPAELQGGVSSIQSKSIPTNLSAAHSRVVGSNFFLNNRYNLGHYTTVKNDSDSVAIKKFVPVSAIIWTFNWDTNRHIFRNTNATEDHEFWEHTYLDPSGTYDRTSYHAVKNTIGISLLEGFNKYAAASLTAFATHEYSKFTQTTDTVSIAETPEGLDPYPYSTRLPGSKGINKLWVGGRLARENGKLLNYSAIAQFGVAGRALGEVKAEGKVSTRFKLFGDSVKVAAYGSFENREPSYLLENYVSNHFIWRNDFSKTKTVRFGGSLDIRKSGTYIDIGVSNINGAIYFNPQSMPVQHNGGVQVFHARLNQNLKAGILHWDNRLTYQATSNEDIIPLPALSVYSNLYLQFRVAKVLHVQLGVDCDYFTRYRAPSYQPATMSFINQDKMLVGNYPYMNVYANMRLSKARFYVMFSHVNQGMTGNNYFSMPHYPLNPRKFLLGVSVDFAD